jgi:hypothetical protein
VFDRVRIRARARQKRKEKENPDSVSALIHKGYKRDKTSFNLSSAIPFQTLLNTGKPNSDRTPALSLLYSLYRGRTPHEATTPATPT